MRLTIMCGLPDSGKTTKANELAAETGAVCLHHDQYYSWVLSGAAIVTTEMLQQVFEAVYVDIRLHLSNGEDVIYDSVCATNENRQALVDIAREEGAEIVCVYMDTPLEVCEERNPMGWARVFSNIFTPPTEEEGFDEIVTIAYEVVQNEAE